MPVQQPFPNWKAVLSAPRSEFFRGHTSDTVFDRSFDSSLVPMVEANFTQSNARVLFGQAANGSLRFIAMPTQVYPAPTGEHEFGLYPGMYHHFDAVMYAGDLTYQVSLDGSEEVIDLGAAERENETSYADYFLPITRAAAGSLAIAALSYAPVAADAKTAALAPAPLPGPAGGFYLLHLRNTGAEVLSGKVTLTGSDLLVGDYEDAAPEMRATHQPEVTVRQHTLILSRPDGSVGIHLHEAEWVKTSAPYAAEKRFTLQPGEEQVFETYLALGATYAAVMPVIFELHMKPALEWLNLTAAFWHSRLGELRVGPGELARFSQEITIRGLLDNFNCLQTDAQGNLLSHWQGAPSHGYGTIWGIDVEPTAVSIVNLCPELTRQTALFFMTRSRAPRGTQEHSVPILVAPVIIARQWLQVSGDTAFLERHPEVLTEMEGIMQELLALKAPGETLFPSRYSSDGPVGRRYDYGTNVKAWYAFESMAYLLEQAGRAADADQYRQIAREIPPAIQRTMLTEGPFGVQISGGTNLGEDPGSFYLPEDFIYYDGEDTSSMLAPIYGMTGFDDLPWINYHRFARSLWCCNYDPEFETLQWFPTESAVLDGTAYISRLGGSLTRAEMREALENIRNRYADRPTGSLFWWPHGDEFRRGITRCSQGAGTWAWQYLYQWLGLVVDAPSRTLAIAPRGLLTTIDWQDFAAGPHRFGVRWSEGEGGAAVWVKNHNDTPWTLRIGVRAARTGAEGALAWHNHTLAPGAELHLNLPMPPANVTPGMTRAAVIEKEVAASQDAGGLLFKRFGPAMLRGDWDGLHVWKPTNTMPLTLRFVIANASGQDFERVTVSLTTQDGWLAQGRRYGHWDPPDALCPGEVKLDAGHLASPDSTVASFWIRPPTAANLPLIFVHPRRSPHTPSQPGEAVNLFSRFVDQAVETSFSAELRAVTKDGLTYTRRLVVPLRIAPLEVEKE